MTEYLKEAEKLLFEKNKNTEQNLLNTTPYFYCATFILCRYSINETYE